MKIKTTGQKDTIKQLKNAGWEMYGRKTDLGSQRLRKGPMVDRREVCVYHDGSYIEYPAGRG